MVGGDWRISIFALVVTGLEDFDPRCLDNTLFSQGIVMVPIGCWVVDLPRFRNFNSIIPIDVVRLIVRVHGLEFGGGEGGILVIGGTWRIVFVKGGRRNLHA